MNRKLNCIMLVDDNPDDNFYHQHVIHKHRPGVTVICTQSGQAALDYLRARGQLGHLHPNIIFLDINMPGMNGWAFLEAYIKLDEALQSEVIVVMLTTSENPNDMAKAGTYKTLCRYKIKPLTKELLDEVIEEFLLPNHSMV